LFKLFVQTFAVISGREAFYHAHLIPNSFRSSMIYDLFLTKEQLESSNVNTVMSCPTAI
jgi:hypothetical protein